MIRKIFLKQNIMINTNFPRNCVVFLLPRRLTQSAIYGSQVFYSHKWPTVLVRKVKGKPRNFKENLCGSLYSTFKISFQSCILQQTVTNAFQRPTRSIQGNVFLKPNGLICLKEQQLLLFKTVKKEEQRQKYLLYTSRK